MRETETMAIFRFDDRPDEIVLEQCSERITLSKGEAWWVILGLLSELFTRKASVERPR